MGAGKSKICRAGWQAGDSKGWCCKLANEETEAQSVHRPSEGQSWESGGRIPSSARGGIQRKMSQPHLNFLLAVLVECINNSPPDLIAGSERNKELKRFCAQPLRRGEHWDTLIQKCGCIVWEVREAMGFGLWREIKLQRIAAFWRLREPWGQTQLNWTLNHFSSYQVEMLVTFVRKKNVLCKRGA